MTIHIQNAAQQMIDEFNKHGFNGVRFEDCRMELPRLDDWLNDGRTEDEFNAWIAGYACFILLPITDTPRGETKYNVSYFDGGSFEADLEAEMRRRFGDDVTINYSEGCHEYEVIRKDVST